jgi:glucose/mannose-6-phosphate isomerase
MDLDDIAAFEELDASQMISYIRGMPDQLMQAWELGEKALVPKLTGIDHILICSTGSSAIAATLVKQYLEPICQIPVIVWQDCEIPVWAQGERTLVLVSGITGEEKELLASFESGLASCCQVMVIATGGSLIGNAKTTNTPYLVFDFPGPSRAALGFEFVLPLAVLFKAGLIKSPKSEISSAAALLKKQQSALDINSPVVQNRAKRMAGQFFNRLVILFSSKKMHAVAMRWKSQIHENAKAWAQVETITETRHSTAGGIVNPESSLRQMMTFFLQSTFDEEFDQLGLDTVRRLFMVEGFNTDFCRSEGDSLLENMWSAIQFGDFISYYLAMAYEMDPTAVPGVEEINSMLTE